MGVSGCGKSLIGKKLAHKFKCKFIEGDDYHSLENKKKMESGFALNDNDRENWLHALKNCLSEAKERVVLSCSALKKKYRKILSENSNYTLFIHLDVGREILETRLKSRKGHFFNPLLLQDQLNTLEALDGEEKGFSINSNQNCEIIIAEILSKMNDRINEW